MAINIDPGIAITTPKKKVCIIAIIMSGKTLRYTFQHIYRLSRSIHLSCFRKDLFDVTGEKEFKEKVLDSKKPVVVDFHAGWCGPCLQLAPSLSKVIESRKGRVDLAKVNIDQNQELAIRYGVASIPTVILMQDGEMKSSFVGLVSEKEIEAFVPYE